PRVVGRRTTLPTAEASTLVPVATTLGLLSTADATATLARGSGHLRGRVPQRGTDLVHIDLEDGPLLTLRGFEGALLQPALHTDPHATLKGLGDVLGVLAPHGAGQEHGLSVLPLPRLAVEGARGRRDTEVGYGHTVGGEAQFRVVNEVADERDLGFSSHVSSP